MGAHCGERTCEGASMRFHECVTNGRNPHHPESPWNVLRYRMLGVTDKANGVQFYLTARGTGFRPWVFYKDT